MTRLERELYGLNKLTEKYNGDICVINPFDMYIISISVSHFYWEHIGTVDEEATEADIDAVIEEFEKEYEDYYTHIFVKREADNEADES